ncbi:amino acid-binding protein [Thermodesulfobacteriota bacterium]
METVKQISLTLKNEPGTLLAVSELLSANNTGIIALYISSEQDAGKFRFVSNDPEKAVNILKTAGYDAEAEEVVACETPNHPGGLNAVLKSLSEAGINVAYIYPCLATGKNTVLILAPDSLEKAIGTLKDNWIRVLGEDLYHI